MHGRSARPADHSKRHRTSGEIHVHHVQSRRHDPPPLHAAPGRRGGAGGAGDDVHQHACWPTPAELQRKNKGRHPAVDERRPQHDGHLGPQARRPDRRPVQADQHQRRRRADLRAHADDGQADAPHVDRPLDEHPRSRSQPRPLLHAHRLRAQPEHRASQLRRGDRPRADDQVKDRLEIPPFVSVGGGSVGPGFLGMTWAPFVVSSNGQVRNLNMQMDANRVYLRQQMLAGLRRSLRRRCRRAITSKRASTQNRPFGQGAAGGRSREDPRQDAEPDDQQADGGLQGQQGAAGSPRPLRQHRLRPRLPDGSPAGRGGRAVRRSRSRRLGQPQRIFPILQNQKLPELDKAMSALVEDLAQRGLLQDTAIIWMGEFSRTPRINGNAGRDHWARSWSVVVGGAGMKGGIAVGETNADGTKVETEPYTSQDVMASVCKALGISLETTFTSKNGRPMKIANSGKVIKELFA